MSAPTSPSAKNPGIGFNLLVDPLSINIIGIDDDHHDEWPRASTSSSMNRVQAFASLWTFTAAIGLYVQASWIPTVDRMALAAALSRLVKAGELIRVRRGLYYWSKATRFGPSRPDPEALVDAALRARGADPVSSGAGEYNRLGLTTQVSGAVTRATRRRVPRDLVSDLLPGIALHTSERPLAEQPGIRAEERTALDALRDVARIPDARPGDIVRRLLALLRAGHLDYARLARFARAEPPRVRALLGALGDELRATGAGARAPATAVHALRASLNPLTSFAIPGVRAELSRAADWKIK